jgi:hypothetical protein
MAASVVVVLCWDKFTRYLLKCVAIVVTGASALMLPTRLAFYDFVTCRRFAWFVVYDVCVNGYRFAATGSASKSDKQEP